VYDIELAAPDLSQFGKLANADVDYFDSFFNGYSPIAERSLVAVFAYTKLKGKTARDLASTFTGTLKRGKPKYTSPMHLYDYSEEMEESQAEFYGYVDRLIWCAQRLLNLRNAPTYDENTLLWSLFVDKYVELNKPDSLTMLFDLTTGALRFSSNRTIRETAGVNWVVVFSTDQIRTCFVLKNGFGVVSDDHGTFNDW